MRGLLDPVQRLGVKGIAFSLYSYEWGDPKDALNLLYYITFTELCSGLFKYVHTIYRMITISYPIL